MSRARNPFSPGMVLGVLAVGAIAFLLFLYALGQGWTGGEDRNGGAHAASNGLTGFAGLVSLLERTGHDVRISRSRADLDEYGLLVLTPQHGADADDLNEIIQNRMELDLGPTLLILPKWFAFPVPEGADVETEDGWVMLAGSNRPEWFEQLDFVGEAELDFDPNDQVALELPAGEEETPPVAAPARPERWSGFGESGNLPGEGPAQALDNGKSHPFDALVVDNSNDLLVGKLQQPDTYDGYEAWPVIVAFEPDLLNNYGLGDRARAQLAAQLVDTTMYDEDLPIIFDLTYAGLGASENLLTLAFTPPFLAATLCLLLAALVIGWRAFRRFGPPLAEAPAMARGKRQLARNGASLVARAKRFHLLKQPFEALVGRRVAEHLGLRVADMEERETAIDRVLQSRGHAEPGFARLAQNLREAEKPRDIIRAARALRQFERELTT